MDLAPNAYLTSFYSGNVDQEKLDRMLTFVARYQVLAHPEKIFSLKEVAKAHEYLASHHSLGKVIVLN